MDIKINQYLAHSETQMQNKNANYARNHLGVSLAKNVLLIRTMFIIPKTLRPSAIRPKVDDKCLGN